MVSLVTVVIVLTAMLRCLRPGVPFFQTTDISAASRPVTHMMRRVFRMVTVTVVK